MSYIIIAYFLFNFMIYLEALVYQEAKNFIIHYGFSQVKLSIEVMYI